MQRIEVYYNMCVITFKTKNTTKLWTDETLKTMYENNSDGCGLMFMYDNKIYFEKGFLTFESFKKRYDFLNKKYDFKKIDVALHFRISTHANVDETNTHPFMITNNFKNFELKKGFTDMLLMHNGIINSVDIVNKKYNDTCHFIKQVVYPLKQLNNDFILNDDIKKILKTLSNSKLLFLSKNGFDTVGEFINDDNIYYSNSSYKNDNYSFSKYSYNLFKRFNYFVENVIEITLTENDVDLLHDYNIYKRINDKIYLSDSGYRLVKANDVFYYLYSNIFLSSDDFDGKKRVLKDVKIYE